MGDMGFNTGTFHYGSRRELVYGKNGMVATSHPLAAQAGRDILKAGGNAIDAAVATAAALTVVEPGSNGIGGDSFSIIWKDEKLYGLNASGPSPKGLDPTGYLDKSETFPTYGLKAVNVPGIPAGWAELVEKHGKLSLEVVLEPAAKLADEGVAISDTVHNAYRRSFKRYTKEKERYPELASWFDVYAPEGRVPDVGEVWASKGHARTLRLIGQTGARAFYTGEIAEAIASFSQAYGGYLRKGDLSDYKPEWVAPVKVNYKGYEVWEMPPNGQGVVALMALNILKQVELRGKDDPDTLHKQIEAIKLAFSDGQLTIADTDHMKLSVSELLSEEYAKERAALIQTQAIDARPGIRDDSGTVYLATADNEGNMVSYIQSNYMGFGSGAVVPEYGVSLNNRAVGFVLEEGHVNALAPGKRPFNTIIPGFLTKNNRAVGPFGIMGGHMQPQAHLQVLQSMIDFKMNPQDALDAPRWQWVKDKKVMVEPTMPLALITALKNRGHAVEVELEKGNFGRGEIIIKTEHGTYIGATEPRTDGMVAVW
ncbi:gamma-glutamyltranspeptidase / glutathione hydrolase [Alkalibacterium subtropicum]|uniref:Glutathione hydrolase proenzyme n=1 Tax=Alkalibacterium subtropicum TaxID=753702 RepID=A0A1I1HTT6_9LACT|nr:gamma-glutamyltransferase [Alkalibacterium subtropicum]SFC27306.1 gamma-glutamyltranspeptidase / glutathione hydrolase [Alkalibacterium subtropicum]